MRLRRLSLVVACLSVAWAAEAHAVTRDWLSATSLQFGNSFAWLGFSIPGASDLARFNVAGNYTVGFDVSTGNRTTLGLDVLAGGVSFQGDPGRTYTVPTVNISAAQLQLQTMILSNASSLSLNAGGSLIVASASTLNGGSTLGVSLGSISSANENALTLVSGLNTSLYAYLGETAGGKGRATIANSGTTWTLLSDVYVGRNGTGILDINSGGKVTNRDGWLGWNVNSVGTATVGGTGSTWTSTRKLSIGDSFASGVGTLTVNTGGRVNVGDNSTAFTVTGIVVGDNDLAGDNGGDLFVYNGSTLTNASGGVTRVGFTNAYGRVTVSGTDSKLLHSNGSGIAVGVETNSKGFLDILAGGRVESSGITVGGFGGTGTVNVIGTNSVLKVTDAMQLSSPAGAGTGIVTTSGGGTLLVGDAAFEVEPGVTYVGDNDPIGTSGGILSIANGSTLSTGAKAYVGLFAGQSGRVTVSGAGSAWTNQKSLQIGSSGVGELIVSAGGSFTATTENLEAGAGAPGMGTISVSGANSRVSSAALNIGIGGTGILNINAGGTAAAATVVVGDLTGSVGTITMDSAGTLDVNNRLAVGLAGSGTFSANDAKVLVGDLAVVVPASSYNTNITASAANAAGHLAIAKGGSYSAGGNTITAVAYAAGSFGNVVVNGASSTLTSAGLSVGESGTGRLDVQAGAHANTTLGSIVSGYGVASDGTIAIDGNGSYVESRRDLELGVLGAGRATLTSTNSGSLYVGDASNINSPATLVVSDANAAGTAGGVLFVRNSSSVNFAGSVLIGPNLNGGQFGRLQLNAPTGSFTSRDLITIGPFGTLDINAGSFTTTDGASGVSIQGTGKLNLTGGTLVTPVLDAGIASSASNVVFSGGRLDVGSVNIGTGRTFTQTGGTFAIRGASSGASTQVTGSYLLSDGTIEAEHSAGFDDRLIVSGPVTLNGGNLSMVMAGYGPFLGQEFPIITGTSRTGRFATVSGVSISPTMSFAIRYTATEVRFRIARPGDANFDNAINFDDLLALAQNYDPATTGKQWIWGDFTGDGKTNFDDLLILAQNYGLSGVALPPDLSPDFASDWAMAQSLVPEPGTIGVGMAAFALLRRRRC